MKTLTKGQRFALAREARRLAMEEVAGVMRQYVAGSWCGCAIGEVMRMAGVGTDDPYEWAPLAYAIDSYASDGGGSLGLVSHAVMEQVHRRMPGAVVFPLLALADALEASAASARKRPQKQSPEVP